ncbi:MAG: MmgE/PrpD family protein, partial [Firmicutes bacterium]|nr:MmgE/PrpD family protein [Bacillota bacterium]
MTLSEILGRSVADPPEFTEKAVYYAKRAIIDTFAAMIVGTTGQTLKLILPDYQKVGNCSLLGSGVKLSPRDAAFLNGISGHDYELDDTGISGQGHPSVVVLPAVLAQAEEQDADGLTLIKAFLIAQEVENRIGGIIAWECHEKGWHTSGLEGALGASAGVSYLLGLDSKKVQNAIGIAASFVSGLRENFGTMTKCVHIGKTNEDGLRAAYLAKA